MHSSDTLTDPANDFVLDLGQDLVLKDAAGNEVLRLDSDGGRIRIRSAGRTVALLDGKTGNLKLGGAGVDGDILLFREADDHDSAQASVRMNAQRAEVGIGTAQRAGALQVDGPEHRVALDGSQGRVLLSGQLAILPADSGQPRVQLLSSGAAFLGGDGTEGRLGLRDGNGNTLILLDARNASIAVGGDGEAGEIRVLDANGQTTLFLNGATGNLAVGGDEEHGTIFVKSGVGEDQNVFVLNGERGDVILGCPGRGGDLSLRDDEGKETILIRGDTGNIAAGRSGKPGNIFVKSVTGGNAIHLSGETGNANITGDLNVDGDVRLSGGDCAEEFPIAESTSAESLAGSVMSVRDDGTITPTTRAYDKRVVGIVSGAGDLRPGLTLDAAPSPKPRAPIALGGKVCCLVDASPRPVEVGDLLVSSDLPGHAMVAHDPLRAFGCVIGKALESLDHGRGLIRVFAYLN